MRSGYDDAHIPEVFEDAGHAHGWLGPEWHPDHFDLDEVNAALSAVLAEPGAVIAELAELLEQLTERSGITSWWIGKANREDLTPPVAGLRASARALGLVTVRKGRLGPTAAGLRCRDDPSALLNHIVGRLPLGTKDHERQAGWMALVVAGSGAPAEQWREEVTDLLFALGWRAGSDRFAPPHVHSSTLTVLEELSGACRTGWRITGTDDAVAATARAVIRPRGTGA